MTHARQLLGIASNSFSKGPCRKSWVSAGPIARKQVPTPKSSIPAVQFTKSPPQLFGEVQGETLNKLPLPHSAFMALHLDMTLVTQNADRPVGGSTSQFIPNWHKLTQDQWVLDTVQGYHLSLSQWPDQQLYTKKAGDNQQLVLEVEVQKLVEKGAA